MSGVELPAVIVAPSPLPKTGLSEASFSSDGVGPQVRVAGDAEVGRDEVVEEAALVGGREVLVAGAGQLVLGLAGDAPLGGGERHVLAHRQPGARLDVARGSAGPRCRAAGRRAPWPGRPGVRARLSSQQRRAGPRSRRSGASDAESTPPAMPDVDLAEGDLVGDEDGGLEARCRRPAGCRRPGSSATAREPSTRLPGEVEVAAVLEHRTRRRPRRAARRPGRSGPPGPSRVAVSMSWLDALA